MAADLFYMFTQWIKFYTFDCHILNTTNVWKMYSNNEWLLFSASFRAKYWLIFFLEVLFQSQQSIGSFKKQLVILKILLFLRNRHVFMQQSLSFKCFQYFNFETNFLKDDKLFQKAGIPFLKYEGWKCNISMENCLARSLC